MHRPVEVSRLSGDDRVNSANSAPLPQNLGFDLPLAFGVGLTYTYINQNMVVSDVRIEGRPLDITVRDAETVTHTGVFRADTWVFPFMNVYGLFRETAGVTKPAVVFPNGQVVGSSVDYNRFSYGGGMTLAGGYKAWFLTLDANWTTGDIISKDKGQVGDKLPVEPNDSWNLVIGGNWQINKRWSLTAEIGGVLDRFHAIGAVMWRF